MGLGVGNENYYKVFPAIEGYKLRPESIDFNKWSVLIFAEAFTLARYYLISNLFSTIALKNCQGNFEVQDCEMFGDTGLTGIIYEKWANCASLLKPSNSTKLCKIFINNLHTYEAVHPKPEWKQLELSWNSEIYKKLEECLNQNVSVSNCSTALVLPQANGVHSGNVKWNASKLTK